jgi:hypothetical protein
MKKKTIIVTHIDTASHGYYSVSKKDFLLIGGEPEKITGCSGHTYTRLYLEEDCDATYFFDKAKENGFEVTMKMGYNPKFAITHNYNAQLFSFEPKVGNWLILSNREICEVKIVHEDGDLIVANYGSRYRIPKSNPFQYIVGIDSIVSDQY